MFENLGTLLLISQLFGLALNAVLVAVTVLAVRGGIEASPDILGMPAEGAGTPAAARRSKAVQEAWAGLEAQAARSPDSKRLAVIDADRLVDRLLKDAGYEGQGALDRMRQLPADRLATVSDLIAAHRLRNRLVHEVGYRPDDRELDAALSQFRAFLSEVGYL